MHVPAGHAGCLARPGYFSVLCSTTCPAPAYRPHRYGFLISTPLPLPVIRFSRLVAFALVVGAGLPLAAQPGPAGTFSFLRLEPTARAAALAGAFGAVPTDDPAVLYYNPAALGDATDGGLSLSYLNHLGGLNAGFAAYGRRVRGLDAALSLRYLGWGEIPETDEFAQETGTFGASNLALTLGAARPVAENVRLGVSVHGVLSTIAEHRASALAADVGVVYTRPEALFAVGASVHNVGVTLASLGATRDELPLDVRLSVSKRLAYLPLLVTVTGYNLHDPGVGPAGRTPAEQVAGHVAVGGELQFSPAFNVRAGFNPRRNQELRTADRLDTAGLSLGFGLRVRGYTFDYGFGSWSANGALHQFTLRTVL